MSDLKSRIEGGDVNHLVLADQHGGPVLELMRDGPDGSWSVISAWRDRAAALARGGPILFALHLPLHAVRIRLEVAPGLDGILKRLQDEAAEAARRGGPR